MLETKSRMTAANFSNLILLRSHRRFSCHKVAS
jgi:hypothetical protein